MHSLTRQDSLVHAFISCRLDNCNTMPCGTASFNDCSQCRTPRRGWSLTQRSEHITPVLCSLHWLPCVPFRNNVRVPYVCYRKKSCRRAAATICPRPGLQVVTRYTSCMHMDRSPLLHVHVGLPVQPTKAAWWPWPIDLENGVRVTCDVSYLCANFGHPRPLCSRFRPMYATDRQTSDKIMA